MNNNVEKLTNIYINSLDIALREFNNSPKHSPKDKEIAIKNFEDNKLLARQNYVKSLEKLNSSKTIQK
jgi:hypothetical protein